MAQKGHNERITETLKDDEKEFRGSGVEGKKGTTPLNKSNNQKEEDLNDE